MGRLSFTTLLGIGPEMHTWAGAPGVALLCLLLSACALDLGKSSADLVKGCVIPADQVGTFSGYWRKTPIPIAFHQGDWSSEEVSQLMAGADTWNNFFKATQGKAVLDYGSSTSVNTSSQAVPTNLCAQGILQGGTYVGQVVIYKQGTWPHSGAANTIALTSFCTTAATPLPATYMAYMEINYQTYFVAGKKLPDLQTIITHELGHLLGLYHSCEPGSTKAGMPDCSSGSLSSSYQAALMFPSFSFSGQTLRGEVKRNLASNDQGRANCLYPAGAK